MGCRRGAMSGAVGEMGRCGREKRGKSECDRGWGGEIPAQMSGMWATRARASSHR